jgi:hypothetical protein
MIGQRTKRDPGTSAPKLNTAASIDSVLLTLSSFPQNPNATRGYRWRLGIDINLRSGRARPAQAWSTRKFTNA